MSLNSCGDRPHNLIIVRPHEERRQFSEEWPKPAKNLITKVCRQQGMAFMNKLAVRPGVLSPSETEVLSLAHFRLGGLTGEMAGGGGLGRDVPPGLAYRPGDALRPDGEAVPGEAGDGRVR